MKLADAGMALERVVRLALPRILTQACRDPGSPAYGCFDRHWWHYKMRDFPSIILQQGAYAVWLAAREEPEPERSDALRGLAAAGCRFWNRRACRHGAFEEYYPWEQGYPPAAFSTLAVAKLAVAGAVPPADVRPGLARACRQLSRRFESRAANQQAAGLAALAWVRKMCADLVDKSVFEQLARRTLALQTEEGWLVEYGGPDLGYLSVALDCLWDLFDATGDARFVASAARAFEFIESFARLPGRGAGMHNARNTDYIVPYGLARFATERNLLRDRAREIVGRLFFDADRPDHPLGAVDDRYWIHYIGHSVIRAAALLKPLNDDPVAQRALAASLAGTVFQQSGHVILRSSDPEPLTVLVSARKGGVFTAWRGGRAVSDFGWTLTEPRGAAHASHWWADFWRWTADERSVCVEGHLTRHRDVLSTPTKHALLRLAGFCLGSRLIGWLKARMIFKPQRKGIPFRRCIELEADGAIRVADEIGGGAGWELHRAPRASKRHVASADSFHPDDLAPRDPAFAREERRQRQGDGWIIETRYAPGHAAEPSRPS